jgi:hypothetical protein
MTDESAHHISAEGLAALDRLQAREATCSGSRDRRRCRNVRRVRARRGALAYAQRSNASERIA